MTIPQSPPSDGPHLYPSDSDYSDWSSWLSIPPRPTGSNTSPVISRTAQGTSSKYSTVSLPESRPGQSFTTSSTTSTKSVPTSPPTAITVIQSTSSGRLSSSELYPSPPSTSSLTSTKPPVNSDSSRTILTTHSTQSLPSTSAADNVSPTSTSGTTPSAVPIFARHSLPIGTIAAAVIVPIAAIALIGAAALFLLRRRRRQGYTRPGTGSRGTREGAIGGINKEKFFRSENHDTTGASTPAPAYASHGQHTRTESESAQPMLSLPPHNLGFSVIDRAYYTGIDTTSEASVHGDGTLGYHDSREGSLVGEAPPPYVRSLGSGRSARSGSGGANTVRAPVSAAAATNRRSVADESVAEEPETPRANPISPFADATDHSRGQNPKSPFDDVHAANDDDAVSEISEPPGRERDRVSEVSDLSYQTSLRSLNASNNDRLRR